MFRQPFMSAERIREEMTAQGFLPPPVSATAPGDSEITTASSADAPSASAAATANSYMPTPLAASSTASGSPLGQPPSSVQPLVMVRSRCSPRWQLSRVLEAAVKSTITYFSSKLAVPSDAGLIPLKLFLWCDGHSSSWLEYHGLSFIRIQALNDIAEVADAAGMAMLEVVLDRRQHGTQSLLLPGLSAMQGAGLFIRIPGP